MGSSKKKRRRSSSSGTRSQPSTQSQGKAKNSLVTTGLKLRIRPCPPKQSTPEPEQSEDNAIQSPRITPAPSIPSPSHSQVENALVDVLGTGSHSVSERRQYLGLPDPLDKTEALPGRVARKRARDAYTTEEEATESNAEGQKRRRSQSPRDNGLDEDDGVEHGVEGDHGEDGDGGGEEDGDDEDGDDDDGDTEEEEDSDEEQDGEDEPEPFNVNFVVPYDGASEKLVVLSDISWKDFLNEVSNIMEIPSKKVSVAYRLNTTARSEPFSHLKSDKHLQQCMEQARQGEAMLAKGRRVNKNLWINLKEVAPAGGKTEKKKGNAKGKGGGSGRKKGRKTQKQKGKQGSNDENNNSDQEKEHSKTGPQYVVDIQNANKCDEHRGEVCIRELHGKSHVIVPRSSVSTWGVLMASFGLSNSRAVLIILQTTGYTSLTTPLKSIKLEDKPTSAPKRQNPPSTPQPAVATAAAPAAALKAG
ncbi:hypothetical protein V5O48_014969 [Marasmius crinis-equi]|uniref:Uncharacterized protein n=1 Tax=Marasmius crinis-equi TaxID=585013 RepID=A0ABR3EVT5_9AGAR